MPFGRELDIILSIAVPFFLTIILKSIHNDKDQRVRQYKINNATGLPASLVVITKGTVSVQKACPVKLPFYKCKAKGDRTFS